MASDRRPSVWGESQPLHSTASANGQITKETIKSHIHPPVPLVTGRRTREKSTTEGHSARDNHRAAMSAAAGSPGAVRAAACRTLRLKLVSSCASTPPRLRAPGGSIGHSGSPSQTRRIGTVLTFPRPNSPAGSHDARDSPHSQSSPSPPPPTGIPGHSGGSGGRGTAGWSRVTRVSRAARRDWGLGDGPSVAWMYEAILGTGCGNGGAVLGLGARLG